MSSNPKSDSERPSPSERVRGVQALNKAFNEDFKREVDSLEARVKLLYKENGDANL